MKFGIFYEHQLPRPWDEGAEHRLFKEALDQVELADRLGIDYAWEVEHHFLEEYSHSSAPEVFLAACSRGEGEGGPKAQHRAEGRTAYAPGATGATIAVQRRRQGAQRAAAFARWRHARDC